MNLDDIINKLKEAFSSTHQNMTIEPDMRSINNEVDTLCHSVRREFERYEDDGIFEIDRLQSWLDKIEDIAFKIDDYEEQIGQEDQR